MNASRRQLTLLCPRDEKRLVEAEAGMDAAWDATVEITQEVRRFTALLEAVSVTDIPELEGAEAMVANAEEQRAAVDVAADRSRA